MRQLGIGLAALALTVPLSSQGAYGIFTHGQGIESQAMGGIAFTTISETYAAFSNPALLQKVGDRLDLGLDYIWVSGTASIDGSAAGPNDLFKSDKDALHNPADRRQYDSGRGMLKGVT
jgi:long-chain fatty acid transport protein